MSAVSDEFFAVCPGSGAIEFIGTEGVVFLGDEMFVVFAAGFIDASNDRSRADVAAYEASSVATMRIG